MEQSRDACRGAEWCDQARPHTQHEATLYTAAGHTTTTRHRPTILQVVAHGYNDTRPDGVFVAIVDSATDEQIECAISWDHATKLGWHLVDAASRWRD